MIFEKENRIFFHVKITANAGHTGIIGVTSIYNTPVFKMQVNAVRERGKANQAIVTYLSELFSVPKSCILIDSGETQPFKKIVILNMDMNAVKQVFIQLGFVL